MTSPEDKAGDRFAEIIARLEKATGPDREIDARIWLIVGDELGSEWSINPPTPTRPREICNGRHMASAMEKYPKNIRGICLAWNVPHFCASIDAALTLVPEGCVWTLISDVCQNGEAGWFGSDCSEFNSGADYPDNIARTPALALCIASLRARAHV